MKILVSIMVAVLVISGVLLAEEKRFGLNQINFNCIAIHPKVAGLIFAGSQRNLYRSVDGGKNWKAVLGTKKSVNFILVSNSGVLYAATANGLYQSLDEGASWRLIYRGRDRRKNVLSLAENETQIFLGTEEGLLTSYDKEKTWEIPASGISRLRVSGVAVEGKTVFLVSDEGVFRSQDRGKTFSKVLATSREKENGLLEEDNGQDQEERFDTAKIICVAIDKNNPENIYLGTDSGVLKSQDSGNHWRAMTSAGLLTRRINDILLLEDKLYAATDSGVYVYLKKQDRWQQVHQDDHVFGISQLAYDNFSRTLWMAGEKGIFNINLQEQTNNQRPNYRELFADEPDIRRVQESAIRYAETEPEKITNWRKQAAKRAWLPQLMIGANRDTADLWHWETGSTTKVKDDVLVKGRDSIEYDVSLSWDLGNLIWNDDQTNIDVRSRLTVQLRNDILDEVNRAYFERRRLQLELLNANIDGKKRLDKELRIEELTATLDGLTGGGFSQMLAKKE